jgi:hypothetical protein
MENMDGRPIPADFPSTNNGSEVLGPLEPTAASDEQVTTGHDKVASLQTRNESISCPIEGEDHVLAEEVVEESNRSGIVELETCRPKLLQAIRKGQEKSDNDQPSLASSLRSPMLSDEDVEEASNHRQISQC